MTAKTTDGTELFRQAKIYMPQAGDSRGDRMVYGAHFKMGMIADTSLQPLRTKTETYEITFPYRDVEREVEREKDKLKVREITARDMDVTVELRYQLDPAPGVLGRDSFILHSTTRRLRIQ